MGVPASIVADEHGAIFLSVQFNKTSIQQCEEPRRKLDITGAPFREEMIEAYTMQRPCHLGPEEASGV